MKRFLVSCFILLLSLAAWAGDARQSLVWVEIRSVVFMTGATNENACETVAADTGQRFGDFWRFVIRVHAKDLGAASDLAIMNYKFDLRVGGKKIGVIEKHLARYTPKKQFVYDDGNTVSRDYALDIRVEPSDINGAAPENNVAICRSAFEILSKHTELKISGTIKYHIECCAGDVHEYTDYVYAIYGGERGGSAVE